MSNWTPSIVPAGRSQTVYLVLNDFGKLGRSYHETGEDEADLETIISSMLEGQYSNPVDVFAFNAAEEWARDVSEYVALSLRSKGDRYPGAPRSIHGQPRKPRPAAAHAATQPLPALESKSAKALLLRYKVDRSQEKDA